MSDKTKTLETIMVGGRWLRKSKTEKLDIIIIMSTLHNIIIYNKELLKKGILLN